ncbi:tetratricopeptide repeat protein [Streptomyces sp. NPDC001941]|uniref:tetratricopeptide repeat protein n=1 Tax=Streptomyces sp. NPDC001941 TaxID=3154659 RepID=UPI00331E8988
MRGRHGSGWAAAVAVAAGALAVTATALLAAGYAPPGPAWTAIVAAALLAVLAVPGKKAVESLGSRWAEPVERMNRRAAARGALLRDAPRVADSGHRMALSIHAAIPLPEGADPALSGSLPEYIARGIDANVRSWIKGHTRTGGLLVLVGPAAAGKTRSLYEALRSEVPDWRVPEVTTGTQLNALVDDGVDLQRCVLWLDELQDYFTDEVLTVSAVRQLMLGRHGPVLLVATIRTEELERLQSGQHGPEGEGGPRTAGRQHAREVVKMLARWSPQGTASERAVRFHVDSRLTALELARARELAEIDPRIASALAGAEEGRITATLAGAPDLIERWTLEAGAPYGPDANGRALITAALAARHCGHPEPVPERVLESLALLHLTAHGFAPRAADWLAPALAWAEEPIRGRISALSRSMARPGVVAGFRVSDVLLQHSYAARSAPTDSLLEREDTWSALLEHAEPTARTAIGTAADAQGRGELAARVWQAAAADGDVRAMEHLGWRLSRHGRSHEAREWFQRAVDEGSVSAMWALGYCMHQLGDEDAGETWMRRAAALGSIGAMVDLGLRLFARGAHEEGEHWYLVAAEEGETTAMANLGYQLALRGDLDGAEEWNRRAGVLGHPGAMENLAVLLSDRGDTAEALEWSRRGALRARTMLEEHPQAFRPWPGECSDDGVSAVVLELAHLLVELGGEEREQEALDWLLLLAEHDDPRAASALADHALDPAEARRWRARAAHSADDLLARQSRSLLHSYGQDAVRRHVDIIRAHADALAAEGDEAAALTWLAKAEGHLSAVRPP